MDGSIATGGEATAAPPPPPTLTHSIIIPHTLPTSLSLCPASLWRPLAGTSLLVDGHALLFWIVDQAFDDDYTQWAGGYQRCVPACQRWLRCNEKADLIRFIGIAFSPP